MTPIRVPSAAERRVLRQFVDAVVALSEDPEPANVERYLEASRALEESRRSRQQRPQARTKTGGARVVV
jgi:hypothetical protein